MSLSSGESAARHIVLFAAERVPVDFSARVATLGGTIETTLDHIGVAVVTGLAESAAMQLAVQEGVLAVEADAESLVINSDAGTGGTRQDEAGAEIVAPVAALSSSTTAPLYARQWNLRAVSAEAAWASGHIGSREVVVAILDTGIDYLHPDFVGLVDLARSKSFVTEDDAVIAVRFPGRLAISDLNGHGTGVASIVASNGTVLSGINRHVTLIAVKIYDRSFQGPAIGRLLSGIVYAADQGADVINISRADTFDKSTTPGIVAAVNRATNYASRKGAVLVSIADNDGVDLDRDDRNVKLPCQAAQVICVSATAPTATAGVNGPWQNVDARASYSAFGRSAVDVAAPGGAGDIANPDPVLSGTQFRRMWVPCTTTATESSLPACARRMPVAQPFGTSFAAPHVSGLAALLVAQLGHGNPALIRARILQSADDLGESGVDPYYGHGRINIARALGVR